jgi:hypothetical protein
MMLHMCLNCGQKIPVREILKDFEPLMHIHIMKQEISYTIG